MKLWRVPYPKFGAGPGLGRTAKVAAALGLDLKEFSAGAAAIVGSNGKGSTAAMAAAMLTPAGRVGLFTSPHLMRLNERFRIDGEDISDDALAYHWMRVQAAARGCGEEQNLGGFEFLFLIGADWFAAHDCKRTVWEAGLGGRLDPVKLIGARAVALTSLDLEHTALLGDTLGAIMREKIAIAPAGANVFVGASCASMFAEIAAECAARGVTAELAATGDLSSPLAGAHQSENAALAAALTARLGVPPNRALLKHMRWPGRLEVLGREPLVVIDVGHTPRAAMAARAGFQAMAGGLRRSILCLGVSSNKDVAGVAAALAPGFARVICASARQHGAPAAQVAAAVSEANPRAELVLTESPAEARRLALARAGARGAILAAGGLFFAAEFRAAHFGMDSERLVFF